MVFYRWLVQNKSYAVAPLSIKVKYNAQRLIQQLILTRPAYEKIHAYVVNWIDTVDGKKAKNKLTFLRKKFYIGIIQVMCFFFSKNEFVTRVAIVSLVLV